MTLAHDAQRLREMAEETCAITARVRTHIQSQDRNDPAFNAEGTIGGLYWTLRMAAGTLEELDRRLNK